MTVGRFPTTRMRRNRRDEWTRRLVAETRLSVDDLIWPIFVIEGRGLSTPVASMPGVSRVTLDRLAGLVEPAVSLGIPAVALFPATPPEGSVPACAEAGILGALTGVVGSLMALEVVREIVGFGEGLTGRLLMIDARAMRFETLHYAWDPANPLSGEAPKIRDLSGHI